MNDESENNIDVDMENSEITFDNLTILKEFGNIANIVRDEDFLNTVPKAKLRRVKWVPMFNCLKQGILDDMVQELNEMWEYENMPHKINLLEKQKEKFAEIDTNNCLWRPQLCDVNSQLRAHDVANLQKQKKMLETLAKEYECRVNRVKKILSARRGYLKALQLDIQKYHKKNEECMDKINERLENHSNNPKLLLTKINIDEINLLDEVDIEIDS